MWIICDNLLNTLQCTVAAYFYTSTVIVDTGSLQLTVAIAYCYKTQFWLVNYPRLSKIIQVNAIACISIAVI